MFGPIAWGRHKEQVDRGLAYFAVNALTMVRAAGAFASVLATSQGDPLTGAIIFAGATLTDFEGKIARKTKTYCNEGAMRDAIADTCWGNAFLLLVNAYVHIDLNSSLIALAAINIGSIPIWFFYYKTGGSLIDTSYLSKIRK